MGLNLDEILRVIDSQGAWPIALDHACRIINTLEGEASGGLEVCTEAEIKAQHGDDPALVACIAGQWTVHRKQFLNLHSHYSGRETRARSNRHNHRLGRE